MSYGRFKGGQHFDYLKKDMKIDLATPEQIKLLTDLGYKTDKGKLTKIRASYLIKTLKAEQAVEQTVKQARAAAMLPGGLNPPALGRDSRGTRMWDKQDTSSRG